MRAKSTSIALAAMLALPVVAFGQSTTATPNGGPASRPPSTMSPAPSGPSSSTATYTTADQMMRASKVIGATVYNDQNESVGSVNELLIDDKHDVSAVVLSVGGFLGMNSKLVKVQPTDIHVTGDRLVMSGMSKDKLKEMPDYKIVPASAS